MATATAAVDSTSLPMATATVTVDSAAAVDCAPPREADAEKRAKVERSLWTWNAAMGALHLIQAIIVLAGSQTSANAKNYKVGLITSIPNWSGSFPVAALQTRFQFPFAGVTSGFAFLSAAAHATVLLCFPKYLADLRVGINVFRWYEYALSSSLMIVLIAILFGAPAPRRARATRAGDSRRAAPGTLDPPHESTPSYLDRHVGRPLALRHRQRERVQCVPRPR